MFIKKMFGTICGCALFGLLAPVQAAQLSRGDRDFLTMAANTNMSEAHLGKMAEDQAANTGVKDFGQKLVRDHTEAYEALTVLANKVGATIPKGIDVRRERPVEDLAGVKGNGFDQRFLRAEVSDHELALREFRREAAHGHDADVKAYASKMIPTLEEHLHIAESLVKSKRHSS